jgi:hypothetical protein
MLMQANGVVPMFEFIEQALQMLGTLNVDLVELLLECAKQALDSSVLPRAVHGDALVADAPALQMLTEN